MAGGPAIGRPAKTFLAACIVIGLAALVLAAPPVSVDAAFRQFWNARNRQEAAKAADVVVESGVGFDDAYARLKKGRTYSAKVPRGVVRSSHRIDGTEFIYTLDVPRTYDPARKYQVRVMLHGGIMMRTDGTPRGSGSIGALAGVDQIYVIPMSWRAFPWWSPAQLENVRTILDSTKRRYNIDENRVALSGLSDGATAGYYFGMLDTTPYASVLPLNGSIKVLTLPSLELRHDLYPHNLLNKPLFVVNGGLDPLYPASGVEPYLRHLQRGGLTLSFQPQQGAGHTTAWWEDVKESFEAFVRDHPRAPLPARLTWETDDPVARGRAHWLVIEKLRPATGQTPLPDLNEFAARSDLNFGLEVKNTQIISTVPGSNADQFGFKPGDVVVAVNDRSVPRAADLLEFLVTFATGTRLTFEVARENLPVELTGVLNAEKIPRTELLFRRARPSGRVDLVREGNTVRATTRGVAEFKLLLSPDAFDFDQPITVIADGRTLFSERVTKSVATLMKWAAGDHDRSMLFGAEVNVALD